MNNINANLPYLVDRNLLVFNADVNDTIANTNGLLDILWEYKSNTEFDYCSQMAGLAVPEELYSDEISWQKFSIFPTDKLNLGGEWDIILRKDLRAGNYKDSTHFGICLNDRVEGILLVGMR